VRTYMGKSGSSILAPSQEAKPEPRYRLTGALGIPPGTRSTAAARHSAA
jgi:hypothetical protein